MACKDKNKKKKRVFKEFTINRLAGVDRPMQGDAQALIMKRRNSEGEIEDQEVDIYKGYRLLSVSDGHTHMINDSDSSGHTSYVDGEWDTAGEVYMEGHSHPWVRNDDGSLSVGEVHGHTHEVIVKSDTTGSPGGQEQEVSEMTDVKKTDGELQVVQKNLEDTQAKLTKALALSEMTDETKAFYKNLPDSEKAGFIAKSTSERAEMISKAKEDDPVVYTGKDGVDYRKSDGEKMVALAKRADKALVIAKAATEKAEGEAFTKRAGELGSLPGDEKIKVALLKAIDGIEDDEIKKSCQELLNAGNSELKKAFDTMGVQGDGPYDETNPENKLNSLTKAYANDKGVTFEKAYTEVLKTPEGQELYDQIEVKPI